MSKFIKILLYLFGGIVLILLGIGIYAASLTNIDPPDVSEYPAGDTVRVEISDNTYVIGNNWFRKSNSGLWEMYVEGNPYQRGLVNGKLAQELVHEQEVAFTEQIARMVPSGFHRNFLRYFIAFFNRDLPEHVTAEYKAEIYGVSRSASPEFNYIGNPYERILNYHAAHDIGHALQNLALVGCSSFGTWGAKSEGNKLLIGRNFDFYVGDRFAENKIVMFVKPDSGHQFMLVTWGGMIGVTSGMNMAGLTITLNAAKSEIPSGAATPVSLLAREVLQYASNINEALEIIRKRKTFVAESFLIGSHKDGKAVNIEITPEQVDVYDPGNGQIVCTNHYESEKLGATEINRAHMEESASVYRSERLKQLIDSVPVVTPAAIAKILRDQRGLNGKFIGYGNEKSVNQLISHHSVIFDPAEKIVWVSTGQWQLGPYVAYRLDSVFNSTGFSPLSEKHDSALTIDSDPFLNTDEYKNFMRFRTIKQDFMDGKEIDVDQLTKLNPGYYHTWVIAGDYLYRKEKYSEALNAYKRALTLEIASRHERDHIIEMIGKCEKKI